MAMGSAHKEPDWAALVRQLREKRAREEREYWRDAIARTEGRAVSRDEEELRRDGFLR